MKIALLQPDVKSGDIAHNAQKVLGMCPKGIELCIIPAEALWGPDDHCYRAQPEFDSSTMETLAFIASRLLSGQTLLCKIYEDGYKLVSRDKIVDVSENFIWQGINFYTFNTSGSLRVQDSTQDKNVLLDLKSRYFSADEQGNYEKHMVKVTKKHGMMALSSSIVGGYGSYIYAGQSVAMDKDGNIFARATAFKEDCLVIDNIWENAGCRIEAPPYGLHATWLAMVCGVRDFIHKCGARKALVGLSGGMDSALTACIAVEALGAENVTGILMPSHYTSQESVIDANELAERLEIKVFTVPIVEPLEALERVLEPVMARLQAISNDLTHENMQARIRGTILMALANKTGALVLNTGNKSESAMGYCTLYGDTVGALAVIGDLYKTQVYQLANWFCKEKNRDLIPERIFTKEPSAELRPNQKDTDSLPPYGELDPLLGQILDNSSLECHNQDILLPFKQKVFANQFKRNQCPPPLLVNGRAPCRYPVNGWYNPKIG